MCTIFPHQIKNVSPEYLVKNISECTKWWNIDNISRTNAYFRFFQKYPEIKWSFLASMVSRNAGWNMCDLEGSILPKALSSQYRKKLFLTYEKANYLIFKDAFPQLMLYHYSTMSKRNLFHFLPFFSVSFFMRQEWDLFWKERNEERLITSLIINEQNVIEKPVIKDGFINSNVFQSKLFFLQDHMHFSAVLFPTLTAQLYGTSVHGFKNLSSRIHLGKVLAKILFNEKHFSSIYEFAANTEHTGSREDYEQYYPLRKQRETPYLRMIYPAIKHNKVNSNRWEDTQNILSKWKEPIKSPKNINITHWYERKQKQLRLIVALHHYFNT